MAFMRRICGCQLGSACLDRMGRCQNLHAK